MKTCARAFHLFVASILIAIALTPASCKSSRGPTGIEPPLGPAVEEWTVTPLANGTAACSFLLMNFYTNTHSLNLEVTPVPAIAPPGYPIPLISCFGTPKILLVQWCRDTGTSLDCPGAGSAQALIFRPDITYTATAKIYSHATGQVVDSKSVTFSGVQ